MTSLRSDFAPSCPAGSWGGANKVAQHYTDILNVGNNSKNFDENLRLNRRNVVDLATLTSCDVSIATATRIGEMDKKLDKICKKLDIEA